MSTKVKRIITYFKKNSDDDNLVGEIALPDNIDIKRLQKLFKVNESNPLYDCYPIGLNEAKYFAESFGISFDLDRYEYYAECHTDD